MDSSTQHDLIGDLALACVRFVKQTVGIELDFSQDTLPVLDHYLRQIGTEAKSEVIGLVAPAAGAYFGEVVRRHLEDGHWHCPGEDYEQWKLEFSKCYLEFNPIGMALSAIVGGEADLPTHLHTRATQTTRLEAAIAGLGEIREDDFYRLAIRFEVIETAHAALTPSQTSEPPKDPSTLN